MARKKPGRPFSPGALSDGTLRFICLAALLLQPYLPTTILLDEPELGLHPYAIALLAELLRGAATKTQVIASTQSVSLVNQFEPDDTIVVERDEGQSVFRHLKTNDMQDWLEDYGLGDLWERTFWAAARELAQGVCLGGRTNEKRLREKYPSAGNAGGSLFTAGNSRNKAREHRRKV